MPTEHHTILRHHREELVDGSGLTDETIRSAGIYSETEYRKLCLLLGRKEGFVRKIAPAVVFPFRGPDGANGYCRIKPDRPRTQKGKPVKYESPLGKPNEVYIPPKTFGSLEDTATELVITEGEKKALKADQEGFRCLGLVGVYGWKDGKSERLLPALEYIKWKDRPVVIAFDSDIDDNPAVLTAESRLAAHLKKRGARVTVARIPAAPDGAKQGVDDFLVVQGPGEFRKLLDAAMEPEPVAAAEMRVPAKSLDPYDEAQSFIREVTIDGASRLRFWQGSFYWWSKGRFIEMSKDDIRGEVVQFLNRHAFGVTTFVVNNVTEQLKALTSVGWRRNPPCWLAKDNPWPADEIVVAKNGIFHLPSVASDKEPMQADLTPKLFTQSALNYDLDFAAPRPEAFFAFLDQLWPNDQESINTLQEWFGYLLSADTSQQKLLLLIGPTRSGKGTIARVIQGLVGPENVCGPTLPSLASQFGLWPLVGKSVAIVPDARISGRADRALVAERILSITGEDTQMIDRKFAEPLNCKLSTRLVVMSNELPRLTDASSALGRRMVILRLQHSWYGKEDKDLTKKLLAELPSILGWAIVGWARLQQRGHFLQPKSGAAMVEEVVEMGSPVSAFVEDWCELGPECEVSRDDLYQAYRKWCEEEGRGAVADRAGFGRDLSARFPKINSANRRCSGSRSRYYVGIKLRLDATY